MPKPKGNSIDDKLRQYGRQFQQTVQTKNISTKAASIGDEDDNDVDAALRKYGQQYQQNQSTKYDTYTPSSYVSATDQNQLNANSDTLQAMIDSWEGRRSSAEAAARALGMDNDLTAAWLADGDEIRRYAAALEKDIDAYNANLETANYDALNKTPLDPVYGMKSPGVMPMDMILGTSYNVGSHYDVMGNVRQGAAQTARRRFDEAQKAYNEALERSTSVSNTELAMHPEYTEAVNTTKAELEAARAFLEETAKVSAGATDYMSEIRARGTDETQQDAIEAMLREDEMWNAYRQGMATQTPEERQALEEQWKNAEAERIDASRRADLAGKMENFDDKIYSDDFFGQFGANYTSGRLGQDEYLAWNTYLNFPTEENRAYAEGLSKLREQATIANSTALDDEGAVLPWLSKDLANYLPQFLDQTGYNLAGGALGAAFGGMLGRPDLGAKAGTIAGSGAYSFQTMRGAAFKTLLDAGVDEETARAAANDEAFISSIIEMGETGLSLIWMGGGKLINALTKGGGKELAKAVGKNKFAQFAKMLAKYGLNIFTEGVEEGTQEAVSIANVNRVQSGSDRSLVGDAASTYWNAIRNEDDPNRDRIKEAAGVGRRIAAMMGGGQIVANEALTAAVNQLYGRPLSSSEKLSDAEIRETIEAALETAENSQSHSMATELQTKLDAGQKVTQKEARTLQQATVEAAEAQSAKLRDVEVSADDVNVTYDQHGTEAFNKLLKSENLTPSQLRTQFQTAYEHGLRNVKLDSKQLKNAIQDAAYIAGRADYQQNQLDAAQRAENATVHRKAGFDSTNVPADVTQNEIKIVDDLAKAFGVHVRMSSGMKDNANISGNEVRIDADFGRNVGVTSGKRKHNIVFYAVHEIAGHRMMELAPEEGQAFINAMYEVLNSGRGSKTTLAMQKQVEYDNVGSTITTAEALEELASDSILSLYENEAEFAAALERIMNGKNESAKNGARTFKDVLNEIVKWLKSVISKLTGREKAEAQQALDDTQKLRDLFETAMTAAVNNAKTKPVQKNTAREGDVQSSRKVAKIEQQQKSGKITKASAEAALYDALDHADMGDDNMILLGDMPTYIQNLAQIEGDLYIYRNHTYENLVSEKRGIEEGRPGDKHSHFHDLGVPLMVQAILSLETPSLTIYDGIYNGSPGISMVLPLFDKDNNPIHAGINFYKDKPINGKHTKRPHVAVSFYGHPYFNSEEDTHPGLIDILNTAVHKGRVLDVDKKIRADQPVIAEHSSLGNIARSTLDKNVAQFRKDVNDFKKKNKIQYSVKGADTDYMAAVRNKANGTLERMVREEARANFYDTPKLYRGTENATRTILDPDKAGGAIYATPSLKAAQTYAKGSTKMNLSRWRPLWGLPNKHGIYELYGKTIGKKLVIDAEGHRWNDLRAPELGIRGVTTTRVIADVARRQGYKTVIIKNCRHSRDVEAFDKPSDIYIFFEAERLKSAANVTYDDFGRVIPLSKRFNSSVKDLRRSAKSLGDTEVVREAKELYEQASRKTEGDILKENAKLKRVNAALRDQFKLTHYGKPTRTSLERFASDLLNDYASQANADEIYTELSRLYNYMARGKKTEWETVQSMAYDIAENIISDTTDMGLRTYAADDSATWLANDIIFRLSELPEAKPTFADKQAAKSKAKVAAVRDEKNKKIAQLISEKKTQIRATIRAEHKLAAYKSKQKEKTAEARETRKARELREKIIRHVQPMSEKLLRPTDKKHIPQGMREAVAALLNSINLESNIEIIYGTDGSYHRVPRGTEVGAEQTSRTKAFQALKEQYQKIIGDKSIEDMVIDPSLLGNESEGIKSLFDEVISYGDTRLADMNSEQLQTVWQVVKAVEASIANAGKMLAKSRFATVVDFARAFMNDTKSRKDKKSLTKSHISIDLLTPYTFFAQYGNAGKAFYRLLRDAQDHEQIMQDELVGEVGKTVSLEQREALEKETVEFETERGDKLILSKAQIMELYELSKREQAHDHLLKGGIVQPEVGKVRRGTDAILLTAGDLQQIFSALTKEEIAIANAFQKMTGKLAEWGNKASMDAYGYEKFGDPDYWPIRSASEQVQRNVEKGKDNPRSIANMGAAKNTVPHASNALDINGLFKTFDQHASEMMTYAAWLLPMEDANRLFNFQFKDEEGNRTGKTISGLLNRVGGEKSDTYWLNLMRDIQNGIKAPSDSTLGSVALKAIGNVRKAAVAGNIRVVVQQPTSYIRAALVIGLNDMLKGMKGGVTQGHGWQKALKYAPIASRKKVGGYEIGTNYAQLAEVLYTPTTKGGKVKQGVKDSAFYLAGKADQATWAAIWNACEWRVAKTKTSLTKGSKEFYEAVAEMFTDVIDQTQVVDGVLQRSQAMRSGDGLVKQMTAFMGEPTMALNMVVRAQDQHKYETDPKKRAVAKKNLERAVAVLALTNTLNAFAQSLADAIRDDDEEKGYWERVWAQFSGINGDEETWKDYAAHILLDSNIVNSLNPLTWIPLVKDFFSVVQGYTVERMDAGAFSDFVTAMTQELKAFGGGSKYTAGYAALKTITAGAKLFGSQSGNILRDIETIIRSLLTDTNSWEALYKTEKLQYNVANNKNRALDILYQAYAAGDMEAYSAIVADMIASGVDATDIEAGIRTRAKNAGVDMTSPLGDDIYAGVKPTFPSEEQGDKYSADNLSDDQYLLYAAERSSLYDDITRSIDFESVDDEFEQDLLKAAYEYAERMALLDATGGEIVRETVNGTEKTYISVNGENYDIVFDKWIERAADAAQIGLTTAEYLELGSEYGWNRIGAQGVTEAYRNDVDIEDYLEFRSLVSDLEPGVDYKKGDSDSRKRAIELILQDMDGLTQKERNYLYGTEYKS